MDFSYQPIDKRKQTDLLVVPFWKTEKSVSCAGICKGLEGSFAIPVETEDFKGKEGELLLVYVKNEKEKRIALLGLGEESKITAEKLRRAYAEATKLCLAKKMQSISIVMPKVPGMPPQELVRGIVEGLLLPNYVFDKHKDQSLKDNPTRLIKKIAFLNGSKSIVDDAKKWDAICEAVYFTRNMVNGNADEVTPQYLAETAEGLAKQFPQIKTRVLDKKQIEKEGMGLLLAVNRGSHRDPVFIISEYRGNPASKDHTVLVGKGITFDTGGLNLKATGGIESMRCDMAGAATVLGVLKAVAALKLKINLTIVIPSTENAIDAKSYKPGDVYKSLQGKTVEIGNTDAEGRLVLADALAYAVKHLKPTRIIDLATLTGAMDVALGNETTGFMSNDDALSDSLIRAGSETFERLWRLPLHEEYRDLLKSDIADIKSTGGRSAGSITAAMFLRDFVGQTPWAHLDIASTAFLPADKRYYPKNGTGIGLRLMIEYFEGL